MKHKLPLNQERMLGQGDYQVDNYHVNYLYGLDDLCKQYLTPEMVMLELGCNEGISTNLFAKYVKYIHTIDLNNTTGINKVTQENSNVKFYNMSFQEFFDLPIHLSATMYDVVYIDGNHDYFSVVTDINNSLIRLKLGGIICGHDYNTDTPGVIKAVGELSQKFKELGYNANINVFSDSSWAISTK